MKKILYGLAVCLISGAMQADMVSLSSALDQLARRAQAQVEEVVNVAEGKAPELRRAPQAGEYKPRVFPRIQPLQASQQQGLAPTQQQRQQDATRWAQQQSVKPVQKPVVQLQLVRKPMTQQIQVSQQQGLAPTQQQMKPMQPREQKAPSVQIETTEELKKAIKDLGLNENNPLFKVKSDNPAQAEAIKKYVANLKEIKGLEKNFSGAQGFSVMFSSQFRDPARNLYKNINVNAQGILIPKPAQVQEAKSLLQRAMKSPKWMQNLKDAERGALEDGLGLLLRIDPLAIQDVVEIRKSAGLDANSYDYMVHVYETIIEQVEFLLGGGENITKDSGTCSDTRMALVYPFTIDLAVAKARRSQEIGAKEFVSDVERQQDRLISILGENRDNLGSCIEIDDYICTLKSTSTKNRVWHRGDQDPDGTVVSTPGQKFNLDKKYYKHMNVELAETAQYAEKVDQLSDDDYNKVFQQQAILKALDEFLGYYAITSCKTCFMIDLREGYVKVSGYSPQQSLAIVKKYLQKQGDKQVVQEALGNLDKIEKLRQSAVGW